MKHLILLSLFISLSLAAMENPPGYFSAEETFSSDNNLEKSQLEYCTTLLCTATTITIGSCFTAYELTQKDYCLAFFSAYTTTLASVLVVSAPKKIKEWYQKHKNV